MSDETEPQTLQAVGANAINRAVTWLFGRDSTQTVLMLILAVVISGGWYMVDKLVPKWHGQWQETIKDLQKAHIDAEDRRIKADQERIDMFAKRIEQNREDMYRANDKLIDRLEAMQRRAVGASP